MENRSIVKLVVAGIVLIVGISALFSVFETVETGERGIVLKWGAYDRVLAEGFHIINPIAEDVITMNVRVSKVEVLAGSASRDLQTVNSVVALNYHVNPENAGLLYQQVGRDYEAQIIAPAIQESVKAGTASFTAEELISKRTAVKDAIRTDLTERLAKFNLVVDDFSIVNFDFSEQFNASIERKVTAEQDALASENKLKQVEFEAKQQIEKAKAEAETIRIQAQAITQQGGKDYVQLKAIERWNGGLPQYMLGNSTVPFITIPNNQ